MLSPLEPSSGKLLISEPFLNDPNFRRSVVLIAEYSELGTLGFVLNHKSNLLLSDLLPDLEHADFPVYFGGPVATDTVHFIHRCYDKMNDGEEIAPGIYWGGNFETLSILLKNNSVSPEEVKFFVGYSGWGEDQLADEIRENTWIVSDQYHADVVFSDNEEEVWREVIINLGPKYAHLSNFPQNPNLN
ncbi:YqgE/AlgH family protein [Pedobacter nutrimenti]|jgi:putative transcriptional regulator|uniref:Putative transcriptional regulator n=1 Tax=Pedobacter nutrimenti TaxID=1241337 RepID=A0A318UL51_9SPHI|nr:YqgE/AlgH family protein [Pedobacter nutrimenti]PYF76803.1 putative transcriptional regulator [Pedobacter nutrimenti]